MRTKPWMKKSITLLAIFPNLVYANNNLLASSTPIFTTAKLGNMMLSTAIVLIAIFVLAYGLRRFLSYKSTNQAGFIRILHSMPIGTKERLMLVEMGNGQCILLGVTSQQISTLHVFQPGEADFNSTTKSNKINKVQQFKEDLKKQLNISGIKKTQ